MYREQSGLIPPHLEEDGESSAGFVEESLFRKASLTIRAIPFLRRTPSKIREPSRRLNFCGKSEPACHKKPKHPMRTK